MDKWLEQIFLQRKYTSSQKAHEKMLKYNSHQENAYQNHNEISPHTVQVGHYKKKQKQNNYNNNQKTENKF